MLNLYFQTSVFNIPMIILIYILQELSKNLKVKIHRTIISPAVVYGCETWSLTLLEERRLRVFVRIGC
jgi:hypothetical protein